jgi:hypothetical protein
MPVHGCFVIEANHVRELQKLNHIDAALAALHICDEGLMPPEPTG